MQQMESFQCDIGGADLCVFCGCTRDLRDPATFQRRAIIDAFSRTSHTQIKPPLSSAAHRETPLPCTLQKSGERIFFPLSPFFSFPAELESVVRLERKWVLFSVPPRSAKEPIALTKTVTASAVPPTPWAILPVMEKCVCLRVFPWHTRMPVACLFAYWASVPNCRSSSM